MRARKEGNEKMSNSKTIGLSDGNGGTVKILTKTYEGWNEMMEAAELLRQEKGVIKNSHKKVKYPKYVEAIG